MVLSTHGSGRARGEREEQKACACRLAAGVCENALTLLGWGKIRRASGDRARGMSIRCGRGTLDGSSALIAGGFAAGASRPRVSAEPRHAWDEKRIMSMRTREHVTLSSTVPAFNA